MTRFCLLLLIVLPAYVWANGTTTTNCSREEAMKAEDEVANLKNAQAIYLSYKRFRHCDDGSIAEGYSESVARLLADKWGELEALNGLTSSDQQFERFILRHLDSTIAQQDRKIILSNAREHCPPQTKRLCSLMEKALAR